ncbi:RNB domain-containing ribonuclease [Microbacterium sp. APC 3901]|uniref:RNB domain-containing ribonuclease n=1 Tax=Microbacterium sp. APC 3901 TaxID=3035192 RepID=UPI0025B5F288|nr:RNB domain-containing ribonuclease [Microbacterium sp. APC 3901]MDN3443375.1 RNB domain-containing ribonuclease [Microbacterium sp. APC 3901]
MPQRRSHVAPSAAQTELAAALAALRESLDAPTDFPASVVAEAEASEAAVPELDLRDIPFATLDPLESRDLDQAFHLERDGSGYRVRYAIADVPGFVTPGGEVDAEARRRGQTLYAADGRIPLHPKVLSEDRASLLADVDRPALVWTFALDSAGVVEEFRLERALIRSRAQLDYASTQAALDHGEGGPAALLPEIGALRIEQEKIRGGASLNLPDEEVTRAADGTYAIERRHPLPVEEWNAQLSLMTGMAAASLMVGAGIGILRTMPQPDEKSYDAFRHQTEALGRPWTTGTYGDYLRELDREDPMTLPILEAAASLFRGAGYAAFDGSVPPDVEQAAIAAPYAHATAPLRRLIDRWSLAICLAVSEGREVPSWVRESLSDLPALMQESGQRASRLDSATINCVEAALMTPLVGSAVDATVIEIRGERATVQIADPAVTASAPIPADTAPGAVVRLRVVRADIARGEIEFSA